ncbi:amino acid adenylation domain-containing protein [Ascidiimonas sp. W6]|uniref:amino acid adenylation domain-containing protein n=1 Tax=Ascidiimonas meishanensis TaxID=3128903 RepID=UPI0030EBAD41
MNFQKELIGSLQKNADNIAIVKEDQSVTYSALHNSAQKVTAYLLQNNIKSGTYIGLVIEDRINFITAMIGVMNAGCIFVPIDKTLPEQRLKAIVNELELAYVIGDDANEINPFGVKNIFEISEILKLALSNSVNYPEFTGEDSLYVYFTSGSTGKPKGVIGKNKSLLQFINWEKDTFNIDTSYRFSQFISPYFDAFLRDIFVPLFSGATICIPPAEEDFFTPEKMSVWIAENNISLIHCVPSVFRVFSTDELLVENMYPSLKYVLLSGEKIIPATLQKWFHTIGKRIQLVNLYGLTETTMIRSCYKIKAKDTSRARMPIGKPIADTEIIVADASLKPNNILVPGDLYIISDFMTKGYLNNEELTKERFVEIKPGVIGFKTGDKGRILPDGTIELMGRADRQIKLRGIRIELDEVESLITKSEIVEKIVVVTSDDSADASLFGFVKPKAEYFSDTLFIDKLEAYMQKSIPSYMIPSKLVKVDNFPLLSSGKLDLKKLMEMATQTEKIIVEPINETEAKLLAIWKGILNKEEISTDDSFLKIGGNSLSLMRLIAKIYAEFSVRIPLGELFKNLTIAQQANFVVSSKEQTDPYKIKKASDKDRYPLTAAQRRMYLNYDLDRSSTKYNLPYVVQIKGDARKDEIEKILKEIIQRHDTLRTVFQLTDEGVHQVIKDTIDFELEVLNSTKVDEGIHKFIKPFNLSDGPLFRAGIITDADNKDFLIIDIHHIICDGVSQRNLFTEFLWLYNGKSLEELPLQFKDFAEWEQDFVVSAEYTALREFWMNSFEEEIPVLKLPTINNVDSETSSEGSNTVFHIDKKLINPVIEELRQENVTPFSVLYTCFITFLSQLSGQEDFTVGIAASGRIQEEVQPLVGMFVKALPIRYKIALDKTYRSTVKEVHNYLAEAVNKQLYDLTDIVTDLSKIKQKGSEELFNVMFTFQNYGSDEMANLKKDFELHYFKKSETKFPINLIVSELQNSYEVSFEYGTSYFHENDVDTLIKSFIEIIEKLAEDTSVQMYDLIVEQNEMEDIAETDISFNF